LGDPSLGLHRRLCCIRCGVGNEELSDCADAAKWRLEVFGRIDTIVLYYFSIVFGRLLYFLRVVGLQVVSSMWAPKFARRVPVGETPVRVWPVRARTGLKSLVSRALECEGSAVERIYICDGGVVIWKDFFLFVT